MTPCVRRLPEDGIPVPKHVAVGVYHELGFVFCDLLCFVECVCWLIRLIEYKRSHRLTQQSVTQTVSDTNSQ